MKPWDLVLLILGALIVLVALHGVGATRRRTRRLSASCTSARGRQPRCNRAAIVPATAARYEGMGGLPAALAGAAGGPPARLHRGSTED